MTDRTVYLAALLIAGLIALAVVVGGIVLAMSDRSLPGELIAIGSGAAGAVGALLGRTAERNNP